MKRITIIICSVVLLAVLLCGCSKAAEDVGKTAEDVASGVKENVENMIDNGTVSDRDGYVGDSERETIAPDDSTRYEETSPTDSEYFTDAMETVTSSGDLI